MKTLKIFTVNIKHNLSADESGEIVRHFSLGDAEECKGKDNTAGNLSRLKTFGTFYADTTNTKYV